MTSTDPRVDAYIGKAAPFAQPILQHLRAVIHEASPEIEEGVRWGSPHFFYKGMLCGMAAFTQHCAFGFWKDKLIVRDDARRSGAPREGMGSFGRITAVTDLPPKRKIIGYVRQAMKLNDDGVKSPTRSKQARRRAPRTPADLAAALRRNARAKAVYAKFTPSGKRDYVEWLTEAKTPATRSRRLATALEWIAAGKPRNWKYMQGATRIKRANAPARAAARARTPRRSSR
jgi:uncharacterized protein YdeI (YjbR/CyaY-like superfamily)